MKNTLYLNDLKVGEKAYRILSNGTIDELIFVKRTRRSVHVKKNGKAAIIHGWGSIQVFSTKAEAQEWLKQDLANRIKARQEEIKKFEETLARL